MLYEVFTGKRAFEAATPADLRRAWEHSSPTHPSQLVKDIDPIVERVILRCLEKDPAKRPASALQLAAALPGGDPLATALAAVKRRRPRWSRLFRRVRGPAFGGGLGCAGRSHCVIHGGDSFECANNALTACGARKTPGGTSRARAGYSTECRLFRAAGGHGDGVLRAPEAISVLSESKKKKLAVDNRPLHEPCRVA